MIRNCRLIKVRILRTHANFVMEVKQKKVLFFSFEVVFWLIKSFKVTKVIIACETLLKSNVFMVMHKHTGYYFAQPIIHQHKKPLLLLKKNAAILIRMTSSNVRCGRVWKATKRKNPINNPKTSSFYQEYPKTNYLEKTWDSREVANKF